MYNDPNWNPFCTTATTLLVIRQERYGYENNVADYLYGLTKDDSQDQSNRDKRLLIMRQYQNLKDISMVSGSDWSGQCAEQARLRGT